MVYACNLELLHCYIKYVGLQFLLAAAKKTCFQTILQCCSWTAELNSATIFYTFQAEIKGASIKKTWRNSSFKGSCSNSVERHASCTSIVQTWKNWPGIWIIFDLCRNSTVMDELFPDDDVILM